MTFSLIWTPRLNPQVAGRLDFPKRSASLVRKPCSTVSYFALQRIVISGTGDVCYIVAK
jgi:hypothetical protein